MGMGGGVKKWTKNNREKKKKLIVKTRPGDNEKAKMKKVIKSRIEKIFFILKGFMFIKLQRRKSCKNSSVSTKLNNQSSFFIHWTLIWKLQFKRENC